MCHRAFACFIAFATACFVGSCLASVQPASAFEFVRVWPGWRDAESFERIGEFFGRPEKSTRETILRTQPAERDGYYFLVRVKAPRPPEHASASKARFELKVIRPDAPEPKTFVFPTALGEDEVFQLGITGADWPGGETAHPVAWKLSLLDADGRVLAEKMSFLWQKPSN